MMDFLSQSTNSLITIYPLDIISVESTIDKSRVILRMKNGIEIAVTGNYDSIGSMVNIAKREEYAKVLKQ